MPDEQMMTSMPEQESTALLLALLEQHAAKLPPIPSLVLRLQAELENEWVDIHRLSAIVRSDVVLAGPVLRLANSAFHRGGRPIVEIEDALHRIGIETLRSMALLLVVRRSVGVSDPGFPMQDFWRHALLVGATAVRIARSASPGRSQLEEVWLGGLLHDIGALVAPVVMTGPWNRVLQGIASLENAARADVAHPGGGGAADGQEAGSDPACGSRLPVLDILALERRAMRWDHARLGASFLERCWRLPDSLLDLARAWPAPIPGSPPGAWAIHQADIAAQAAGICWQPRSTRAREISSLPAEARAGVAGDARFCQECLEKSLPMVDAILAESGSG